MENISKSCEEAQAASLGPATAAVAAPASNTAATSDPTSAVPVIAVAAAADPISGVPAAAIAAAADPSLVVTAGAAADPSPAVAVGAAGAAGAAADPSPNAAAPTHATAADAAAFADEWHSKFAALFQEVIAAADPDDEDSHFSQVAAATHAQELVVAFEAEGKAKKLTRFYYPTSSPADGPPTNPFVVVDELRDFVDTFCQKWKAVRRNNWHNLSMQSKEMRAFKTDVHALIMANEAANRARRREEREAEEAARKKKRRKGRGGEEEESDPEWGGK